MEQDTPTWTFGEYEVIRPIGTGGMAALYLCKKRGVGGFERQVVVKVLLEEFLDNEDFVDMFMDEARLMARMSHPHLVQVFDVGLAGPLPYMAMEYVRGPNLSRLARYAWKRDHVELGCMAAMMADACEGMAYAHALCDEEGAPLNVIHRDVTPHNIVVSDHGVAKLIDFGVAKGEDRHARTEVGQLKGKLQYMAPEQLLDQKFDHRVDIFGAGISLYTITTRSRPFESEDGSSLWKRRMSGEFDPPSKRIPGYPKELEAIVLKAMATDPEDRYSDGKQMADDLRAWATSQGVGHDQVKAWLLDVFPKGAEEWHRKQGAKGDRASTRTAEIASTGTVAGPDRSGVTQTGVVITQVNKGLTVLLGLGLLLVLLSLVGVVGFVLLYNKSQTTSTEAVAVVVDDGADEAAEAYVSEAERLAGEGRFQAAIDMLKKAREAGAKKPAVNIRIERLADDLQRQLLLASAEQALEMEQFPLALQRASKILDRSPSDADAIALIKRVRARMEAVEVVAEDDTPDVSGTKRSRPAPKPKGRLAVRSTPSNAVVFVDYLPVGNAPLSGEKLKPGRHTIQVRLDGYRTIERVVKVISGETLSLEFELEAATEATDSLAEAASLAAEAAPTPAPTPAPAVAAPAPEVVVAPEATVATAPEPVAARAAPAPTPAPASFKLDEPRLPAQISVRNLGDVGAICAQVEKALRVNKVPGSTGVTNTLVRGLQDNYTPGTAIVLHPRGMYRYVAEATKDGKQPQQIRKGLYRAHAQGRLK